MTDIFGTAFTCLLLPGGLTLGLMLGGMIIAIMFGVCDLSLAHVRGRND